MAETWWHKTHNNENKCQSHYEALIEHFRKKDLTLFQQKFTRFLTCLVPEKMWRTLQSEKTKTNNNPPLTAMQLSSLVPQFLILQNSPKYPFLPCIFSATIQRNRKERKKGIKKCEGWKRRVSQAWMQKQLCTNRKPGSKNVSQPGSTNFLSNQTKQESK